MPKLSLATPSYNQAELLASCVARVRRLEGVEHVVVDGDSRDDSRAVLERSDVRWVSEPDGGMYDALSKAFAMATGDVLGWVNCDDALLPWTVDIVRRRFAEDPSLGWLYGDSVIVDGARASLNVKPPAGCVASYLEGSGFLAQPSVFFRRELYEEVGGLSGSYRLLGDHDLWHRFVRAGARCAKINEVLSVESVVEGQLMQRYRLQAEEERLDICRRYAHRWTDRSVGQTYDRVMLRVALGALLVSRTGAWSRAASAPWLQLDGRTLRRAMVRSNRGAPYLGVGPALLELLA